MSREGFDTYTLERDWATAPLLDTYDDQHCWWLWCRAVKFSSWAAEEVALRVPASATLRATRLVVTKEILFV